jgi:hypothetical protein
MLHGPYARVSILRRDDGGHCRLRSRIHPTPRVAPAGQGHLGLVWLDHDALWPLAGSPVVEAVFLAADFLERNPYSWRKPLLRDMKAGPWTLSSSAAES